MDNKSKVIVFIAVSVDGFMAQQDGDVGWLDVVERANEDYGQFIDTIDTIIMGRKTYDQVRNFEIPFPHKDKVCYVLSRTPQRPSREVEFYNGNTKVLISQLKKKSGKNIYVEGVLK